MSESMLLWVTRSSPFNLRTTRGLAGIGHRSITAPVLWIRPTGLLPPATEPTAIAFTSGHAISLHAPQEKWRSLPVFTVGAHSAALARNCGYSDVRSADGNVSDLRDLILGSVSRFGHVLHVGACEPAGDLVRDLQDDGLSAELSIVYESIEATAEQLKSVSISLPHVDGIIVHSPRGAKVAAELVRQARWQGQVFALSGACAEPFERMPGIAIETAPAPTEGALIDMIQAFGGPACGPRRSTHALRASRTGGDGANAGLRLVVSNDIREPDAANNRWAPHPEDDPLPPAA
jgi:uroporphyrinogen-III synthase